LKQNKWFWTICSLWKHCGKASNTLAMYLASLRFKFWPGGGCYDRCFMVVSWCPGKCLV